jgi:hypothetical protein
MTMKKIGLALGFVASISFAGLSFAAEKSVTGTLEDSFCFVTMGAHGADHKKCATECATKGIPVALVENDSTLPGDITSKMEDEVTVTGDAYSKGGVNYLTVKLVK